MQPTDDFLAAFEEARQHQAAGRFLDAERIFRHLAKHADYRHFALEALADLYLLQQRFDECLAVLAELTRIDPNSVHYAVKLANLLNSLGKTDAAIGEYTRLLQRRPDEAIAHFNVALLYRKQERHQEAIFAYERAAELGIDRVEEVYSNLANLYAELMDADNAREMYQRAVEIAPENVSTLFNLAALLEESGERQEAIEVYERIQSIDPKHWDSMARLAILGEITAEDQSLVIRLKDCINGLKDDKLAQEVLYFALGKLYDDFGNYDEAASAYAMANEYSKERVLPYVPEKTEAAFAQLIDLFDANWIESRETDSSASPIFICGMYRSGSTLLERMLARHPFIAAGGELHTLASLIAQYLGSFPQGASKSTKEQLRNIADEYDRKVRERVPNSRFVTDKRPDNFLRLGLARAIFPSARIIQTRRHLRDNCLSIYFHQFDQSASYANDLPHIAHYYRQQERLFAHWRECFGENIYTVDYEELIDSPESVLRGVLRFLGLEWDPVVLDFQNSKGLVRTHSIWQVRQGLYSRSRDRWRNYRDLLGSLADDPMGNETTR